VSAVVSANASAARRLPRILRCCSTRYSTTSARCRTSPRWPGNQVRPPVPELLRHRVLAHRLPAIERLQPRGAVVLPAHAGRIRPPVRRILLWSSAASRSVERRPQEPVRAPGRSPRTSPRRPLAVMPGTAVFAGIPAKPRRHAPKSTTPRWRRAFCGRSAEAGPGV
jgi:hypothetical protein